MVKGISKKKDEDAHRLTVKGQPKTHYKEKVIVNFAPIS